MIKPFVDKFIADKHKLDFSKHVLDYRELVEKVVVLLEGSFKYDAYDLDVNKIIQLNEQTISGDLTYVIGTKSDDDTDYYYLNIEYGSCEVCDALENIKEFSKDEVTQQQRKDYEILCLHIVQSIKRMKETEDDDLIVEEETSYTPTTPKQVFDYVNGTESTLTHIKIETISSAYLTKYVIFPINSIFLKERNQETCNTEYRFTVSSIFDGDFTEFPITEEEYNRVSEILL